MLRQKHARAFKKSVGIDGKLDIGRKLLETYLQSQIEMSTLAKIGHFTCQPRSHKAAYRCIVSVFSTKLLSSFASARPFCKIDSCRLSLSSCRTC